MAECDGLAIVTFAKTENDQVNKGELARVATEVAQNFTWAVLGMEDGNF
jgi:hypothetical protein